MPQITPITVYTDGSCHNNGKQDAACSSGVYFEENHPLNTAAKIPGPDQSNQIGEIAAILVTLQKTNPATPLTIVTDSRYTMDGLTKHLKKWEDNSWIGIANSTWFRTAAYHLHHHSAPTSFKWTKGHNGLLGNEHADKLASAGATKQHDNPIDTSIPQSFNLSGAKLETVSQTTAYQGILASLTYPPLHPQYHCQPGCVMPCNPCPLKPHGNRCLHLETNTKLVHTHTSTTLHIQGAP